MKSLIELLENDNNRKLNEYIIDEGLLSWLKRLWNYLWDDVDSNVKKNKGEYKVPKKTKEALKKSNKVKTSDKLIKPKNKPKKKDDESKPDDKPETQKTTNNPEEPKVDTQQEKPEEKPTQEIEQPKEEPEAKSEETPDNKVDDKEEIENVEDIPVELSVSPVENESTISINDLDKTQKRRENFKKFQELMEKTKSTLDKGVFSKPYKFFHDNESYTEVYTINSVVEDELSIIGFMFTKTNDDEKVFVHIILTEEVSELVKQNIESLVKNKYKSCEINKF